MKITYNEAEKCVEIKDGLKNHFLLMKVLMILNLANSIYVSPQLIIILYICLILN